MSRSRSSIPRGAWRADSRGRQGGNQAIDIRRGVAMLNPGSVGDYVRPTYGTLDLSDGRCLPATHVLKQR